MNGEMNNRITQRIVTHLWLKTAVGGGAFNRKDNFRYNATFLQRLSVRIVRKNQATQVLSENRNFFNCDPTPLSTVRQPKFTNQCFFSN